ncbi:hypothetical protein DSP73_21140 [Salmonella enterica]|nr:hypothetical protein [Salmonella enterica]ECN5821017.1 hypothetical protein [Salmonella enterica subsp. enterica serovar Infantis]EDW6859446.1 hypothetical protein [Salmonella enterica]EEJ5736296.1 hypothetical protein [Salmonella enterica]
MCLLIKKEKREDVTAPGGQNDDTVSGMSAPEVIYDTGAEAESMVPGCCTRDTLVSTSEGPVHLGELHNLNRIPDVVTREGRVMATDGVTSGGVQEIFSLLTDSSCIKGASSHRVLRITRDCVSEMTALTDLRKGNVVVFRKGLFGAQVPKYHDECLGVSDAQELGKHISNMSMTAMQVSDTLSAEKFHSKNGYFSINIYNILDKFNHFSYRVPRKILCAPEAFVAAYLRGYFDGGTRFHLNRITATVACREQASDLVYLLSLFGITGKITEILTGFEVVVSDRDDINIFRERITFLKNCHDFTESRSEPVDSGIDYKQLCDEYNVKAPGASQEVLMLPESLTALMNVLDEYKESFVQLKMEDKFNVLKLLSQPGCRTTEVTEYAKYAGRDEVFGVRNVVDSHTWCANGLVVSDIIHPDNMAGQI